VKRRIGAERKRKDTLKGLEEFIMRGNVWGLTFAGHRTGRRGRRWGRPRILSIKSVGDNQNRASIIRNASDEGVARRCGSTSLHRARGTIARARGRRRKPTGAPAARARATARRRGSVRRVPAAGAPSRRERVRRRRASFLGARPSWRCRRPGHKATLWYSSP